ncbi:hypothetical protein [Mesorhizobium sp. CO1-1-8]|uniref:hypothetical protein n=1 Tax=Mesorhizobium sp. CO1-1-8 TaxID=2876631 RepID=UPI001CD166C2|nr:hypothetical protein [Mesorhizobium sp. CO1-1-8]MBZ9777016.1 hypothetical protein [Mesorhizobium sp. CO1-1-8]
MQSGIPMLAHMYEHEAHALVADAVIPVEQERRARRLQGTLQRTGIAVVPESRNQALRQIRMTLSKSRIEFGAPGQHGFALVHFILMVVRATLQVVFVGGPIGRRGSPRAASRICLGGAFDS